MEKRAFIAVVLSLLVLLGYQEWVTRYYGTPAPPAPAVQEPEKTTPKEQSPPIAQTTIAPAKPAVAASTVSGQSVRDVRIDTEKYVAVFTNRGARLKSFEFKNY